MANEGISVIRLRDILLVTVPSDPDDETVSAMQERILETMARHPSRGLILDISTVQTFDSFFARTVAETVQMVALMGGRTVLAGMGASVAITATQLGLTMGKAETALNVDRALEMLSDREAAVKLPGPAGKLNAPTVRKPIGSSGKT